jgi:hypothetical protein
MQMTDGFFADDRLFVAILQMTDDFLQTADDFCSHIADDR